MKKTTREAMHSSARIDWATPKKVFDSLHKEFNFTLDVCATSANAKTPKYFNRRENGLKQDWNKKGANWMNPPYGDPEHPCKKNCKKKKCAERGHHNRKYIPGITDWVEKAANEMITRGCKTVALLPSRTDTGYFHSFIWDEETNGPRQGIDIRFYKGRIKFEGAEHPAPFPSVIVVFDPVLYSVQEAMKEGIKKQAF